MHIAFYNGGHLGFMHGRYLRLKNLYDKFLSRAKFTWNSAITLLFSRKLLKTNLRWWGGGGTIVYERSQDRKIVCIKNISVPNTINVKRDTTYLSLPYGIKVSAIFITD